MKIFSKSIKAVTLSAVLSLGLIGNVGATVDTNLRAGAFTRELIDIVRHQQHYPQSAVFAGVEGELTIKLKIDKAGNIIGKKVIQPSGSRFLDYAALRMIGKVHSFPNIPSELELNEYEFEVPMNFILEE